MLELLQQTNSNLSIVLGFLTPLMVAILALINVITAKIAATKADAAANKVESVKLALLGATNSQTNFNEAQTAKLGQIHALVNNDHGVSLRLTASALKRVAELTNHPDDIKAAVDAELASAVHDAKEKLAESISNNSGDKQ